MSSPSHYEINVAKDGKHVFATSPHSGQFWTEEQANEMYEMLRTRFPAEEGYSLSMTYWECAGKQVRSSS